MMAANVAVTDLRDPPFGFENVGRSLDGSQPRTITLADVAEVLHSGQYGADDWDGGEAAVFLLVGGGLAAYSSWWGPTGSGFHGDAYGGDAEVWFAREENLADLILQALTDHDRELCGLPREGLTTGGSAASETSDV